MNLRVRLLVTGLIAAIPVAVVIYMTNEWMRARDMRATLGRFVTSLMTDDIRERCDSNPNWFLAGPRPDRPTPQQLAAPDADVTAPRAQPQELPIEYYAYDESFQPLSTAGPRFPAEFRTALKSGARVVNAPFSTNAGTGQQQAVLTGWKDSPCAALLFRMRPLPNQGTEHLLIFLSLAIIVFAVALAAGGPLVLRAERLGAEARRSAGDEYRTGVTIGGHDELSSVAFAFNEAAADIRRRATDVKDREESLRRYIASTEENVTGPLAALEQRLAGIDRLGPTESARTEVNAAVCDAHSLSMRLQNLSVAATLRMTMESQARDPIDLQALVRRAIDRQAGFARACGVTVSFVPDAAAIATTGNSALLEQAVNNLLDNAIRYNRRGGQAAIWLDRTRDGRYSLRVSDDGPGAPDEVLTKLNAKRRFRGDEGRTQRPGELGLGLAIVREVCDRLGIQWTFRRSAKGWFEAELVGGIA